MEEHYRYGNNTMFSITYKIFIYLYYALIHFSYLMFLKGGNSGIYQTLNITLTTTTIAV